MTGSGAPTIWHRFNKESAEGQDLKERWKKFRGCRPPDDPNDETLFMVSDNGLYLEAGPQPKAEAFRPAVVDAEEREQSFAPIDDVLDKIIDERNRREPLRIA
jgi:hypothetical protein